MHEGTVSVFREVSSYALHLHPIHCRRQRKEADEDLPFAKQKSETHPTHYCVQPRKQMVRYSRPEIEPCTRTRPRRHPDRPPSSLPEVGPDFILIDAVPFMGQTSTAQSFGTGPRTTYDRRETAELERDLTMNTVLPPHASGLLESDDELRGSCT